MRRFPSPLSRTLTLASTGVEDLSVDAGGLGGGPTDRARGPPMADPQEPDGGRVESFT